jgi:hypothetical protein
MFWVHPSPQMELWLLDFNTSGVTPNRRSQTKDVNMAIEIYWKSLSRFIWSPEDGLIKLNLEVELVVIYSKRINIVWLIKPV